MVNVLPEPVTPISTCCFAACAQAVDQGGDGLRLIAGGLERALQIEIHALALRVT